LATPRGVAAIKKEVPELPKRVGDGQIRPDDVVPLGIGDAATIAELQQLALDLLQLQLLAIEIAAHVSRVPEHSELAAQQ